MRCFTFSSPSAASRPSGMKLCEICCISAMSPRGTVTRSAGVCTVTIRSFCSGITPLNVRPSLSETPAPLFVGRQRRGNRLDFFQHRFLERGKRAHPERAIRNFREIRQDEHARARRCGLASRQKYKAEPEAFRDIAGDEFLRTQFQAWEPLDLPLL